MSTGQEDAPDVEDALVDGDRPFSPGTARAALSHRSFRIVFLGTLASNVGSWMQQIVLGAVALELTGSSAFVAVVTFAQLGPLLLLSVVGGALADVVDRRRLLVGVAVEQGFFSLVLAWVVWGAEPSLVAIVAVVAAIGVGQAVHAPTLAALLPELVDRRDLPGAISLTSANMNLSRVVGPALGGLLYASVGASWAFVGNAFTYLFVVAALLTVNLPPVVATAREGAWARVAGGFGAARNDRVIGRSLVVMALFSLFCLPFVAHIQRLSADAFGISPKSAGFGLLVGTFGLGAVVGALSIGTFLVGRSLARVVRWGLASFAAALAAFSLVRAPAAAYPLAAVVGFCYFATTTSLATVVQQRVDDRVRGRVMALWVMSFGGMVPIGALVAGPLIDAVGVTPVVLGGAAVALALIPLADIGDRALRGATTP